MAESWGTVLFDAVGESGPFGFAVAIVVSEDVVFAIRARTVNRLSTRRFENACDATLADCGWEGAQRLFVAVDGLVGGRSFFFHKRVEG